MDRRIPLPSAPNTRDLGGLPVDGGIVRARQIYRSTMLANLSDEDLPIFESLGVTIIYDMRTEGERISAPDRLPAGIEVTGLDVLADHSTDAATSSFQRHSQPTALRRLRLRSSRGTPPSSVPAGHTNLQKAGAPMP